MEPKIVRLPGLILAGMSFYGDPFETSAAWSEENQIGRLWARFMTFLDSDRRRIPPFVDAKKTYEVHVYGAETLSRGLFEIFAGIEVTNVEGLPLELLVKVLPATDYAVFSLHGEQIISDWDMNIDRWLSEAGYQRSHPFSMQVYDERFKGMDRIADSVLDVYMPVQKSTG